MNYSMIDRRYNSLYNLFMRSFRLTPISHKSDCPKYMRGNSSKHWVCLQTPLNKKWNKKYLGYLGIFAINWIHFQISHLSQEDILNQLKLKWMLFLKRRRFLSHFVGKYNWAKKLVESWNLKRKQLLKTIRGNIDKLNKDWEIN